MRRGEEQLARAHVKKGGAGVEWHGCRVQADEDRRQSPAARARERGHAGWWHGRRALGERGEVVLVVVVLLLLL